MYDYQTERPKLFTPEGMENVLLATEAARRVMPGAGAMTMEALMRPQKHGDSWLQLAAVDYLVETGRLVEVMQATRPAGQCRVFVPGRLG